MSSRPETAGQGDMAALVFLGFAAVAIGLIWYFAREVFVIPAMAVSWAYFQITDLVFGLGPKGVEFLRFVNAVLAWEIDPRSVTLAEMNIVYSSVTAPWRFSTAVALIALTIWVYVKFPGYKFQRVFSLNGHEQSDGTSGFIKYQAQRWAVILPSYLLPKTKEPEMWKRAMRPAEWCRANGVDIYGMEAGKVVVDDEAAERAFIRQLGPRFSSFEELDLIPKVIMLTCVVHAMQSKDRKKWLKCRDDMLASMAVIGADPDTPTQEKLPKIERLWEPFLGDEQMQNIISAFARQRHAYQNTLIIGLIEWARTEGGSLPPSAVLWVKGVDRSLWYALNNGGRSSFHIEGAGSIAHYRAELVAQGPLVEPVVDKAIDGLIDYLTVNGISSFDALDEQDPIAKYFKEQVK